MWRVCGTASEPRVAGCLELRCGAQGCAERSGGTGRLDGGAWCPRKLRQQGSYLSRRAGSCSPGARGSRSSALVPRGNRGRCGLPTPGCHAVLARAGREVVAFTDLAAGQSHGSRSHAALHLVAPQPLLRRTRCSFVAGFVCFLAGCACAPKSGSAAPLERTASRSLLPPGGRKVVLQRSCRANALVPVDSLLPPGG